MKKCIFMNLKKRWTDHLNENNMGYTQHLIFAMFYGSLCLVAGFYLIIHSILPCFFPTAGSDLVKKLNKRFNRNS
jgi:hypothetical protein